MNWLEPLQYEFMWKALLSSALIGLICALLSVFLLLKGWSLMGDALSHAVVPGVAVAYLWQWPLAFGAFSSGLLAAGSILFLRRLPMLRQDAVIGLIFTVFFALGLFLSSIYRSSIQLQTIIFGNILSISTYDFIQMLLIAGLVFLFIFFKWRDLMLLFFDEIQATVAGLPVRRLQCLFFALVSAAVVAALQTVGAILVIALLITPGATAMMLSKRFSMVLILAGIIGSVSAISACYASYFLNRHTGGLMVMVQSTLFLCAFIYQRGLRHVLP